MLSADFADLDADVFGCLRASDGRSAGWLSPPGRNVQELELSGSVPSLNVSGPDALKLTFTPLAGPARFDGSRQWLCRAMGQAGVVQIDCLARVGEGPLEPAARPPWRSVSALMGPDLAFVCAASGADPEAGTLEACILRGGGVWPVDDPRMSTAYGTDGLHERVGLELWETEESEFPLRLAAEQVARATFELAQVRFDCAFLRWHHDGQLCSGCYEIATPAS